MFLPFIEFSVNQFCVVTKDESGACQMFAQNVFMEKNTSVPYKFLHNKYVKHHVQCE